MGNNENSPNVVKDPKPWVIYLFHGTIVRWTTT
jgi:hypothetical protein